ncbi:hypothetical protein ABT324_17375 [Saccharopolyspora sp. NPDC000359]|uniref:hypothetical protein n=1 Tax=Saccharopolyspora sp. NPDC000359 TaxID=3154251 RepID=UPI003319E3CB
MYVQGDVAPTDLQASFAEQHNGLLGAAFPGVLYLITGLHSGYVGLTVELREHAPPVDDTWEEVVEAAYRPAGEVALVSWGGDSCWPLDLTGTDCRVRYNALRMDEANEVDTRLDDEPQVDRYLLQFWPAPPAPDRVLKQTSDVAAYWHNATGK